MIDEDLVVVQGFTVGVGLPCEDLIKNVKAVKNRLEQLRAQKISEPIHSLKHNLPAKLPALS